LWPSRHLVFDRRVFSAANGLRIAADRRPTPGVRPNSHKTPPRTSQDYKCVRGWALDVAGATGERLSSVERALYVLARDVKRVKGRTWREYSEVVVARLRELGGPSP
jgi:hypothetical protein